MKVGRIPIASIALLLVVLVKLIVKYFFAAALPNASTYMDGALMGVLLVYALYYANIYITAWARNRKEEAANS